MASRVATVLGGHHGVFPSSSDIQALPTSAIGRGDWDEVRLAHVERLAEVLGLPRDMRPRHLTNASAMFLAGLVTVSDWIGSHEDHFPHAVQDLTAIPELDPAVYALEAQERARAALERLGWMGWSPPAAARTFSELFSHICSPNPLQRQTVSLADQLTGPSLVIIEAPMGEGKTEAALYLTDCWALSPGQRGCYVALPTQATSNQMFGRVRDFLAARYPGDMIDLQLLHGHAALSAEFAALRRNADSLFEPGGIYGDTAQPGSPPSVVAAEWFTHRKRGLLAPFGVGTIDQALLAVLRTRHGFVRLFGLGHKTVLFDEVHAYDTYMTALLERLLEWLGAMGSSVVLLSATLPQARRRALMEAYTQGLGQGVAEPSPDVPYPRVSWLSASTAGARYVRVSERSTKTVHLEWLQGQLPTSDAEAFGLGERLQAALANGGCAAVICNTVSRAQEVYRALKPYFPGDTDDGWLELDLLHARFLFEERDRREHRILLRFGRTGARVDVGDEQTAEIRRPYRAILVATQVIEQSLDLDFDLMVTDLAPVDLVLQRAGRLHRHERPRPAGLERPTLWLWKPGEAQDGAPDFGRGTEAVYDGHVLLRSWLALRDRDTIRIPEDVEALVEAVYDERSCPDDVSDALRRRWEKTLQEHRDAIDADQHEAQERWLKRPLSSGALWRLTADPREEDAPDFHRAHQALTRLTEPSVAVVCLFGTTKGPSLDSAGSEVVDLGARPTVPQAKRLLERSLSVSDKRVVYSLLHDEVPEGWRQSPLLRNHRLLVLDAATGTAVGRYRLELDAEIGLVVQGD